MARCKAGVRACLKTDFPTKTKRKEKGKRKRENNRKKKSTQSVNRGVVIASIFPCLLARGRETEIFVTFSN